VRICHPDAVANEDQMLFMVIEFEIVPVVPSKDTAALITRFL
jgi:hypothetical protein